MYCSLFRALHDAGSVPLRLLLPIYLCDRVTTEQEAKAQRRAGVAPSKRHRRKQVAQPARQPMERERACTHIHVAFRTLHDAGSVPLRLLLSSSLWCKGRN
jgi:hypothetical protein